MTSTGRILPVFALLLATAAGAYGVPRPKYTGTNLIPQLTIPMQPNGWTSRDMVGELNLQDDDRYRFMSDIFARLYTHATGQHLLFLVMDAGNFHHPKVCFGSSGFTVRELPDTRLTAGERTFAAKTLYARRGHEGFVVIYWMVIDKHRVDWSGQKLSQFWSSLLNKPRVGLMARMDIPAHENAITHSVSLADQFIRAAGESLSRTGYADDVFGEAP
jgi:hypothetical protein